MRYYAFVAGLYLSELQKGLQAGHCSNDMSVKYDHDSTPHLHYEEWATKHKTWVILNAHNHKGVTDVYERIRLLTFNTDLEFYPHAIFHEDEQSMNGMATACGFVFPECVYNVKREENGSWSHTSPSGTTTYYYPGSTMYELVSTIRSHGLA